MGSNPRLLTLEKVLEICNKMEDSAASSVLLAILDAQDARTAAQVKAATLRAVGRRLDAAKRIGMNLIGEMALHGVEITEREIESLRQGKTPAGWEKEKRNEHRTKGNQGSCERGSAGISQSVRREA